ncbi:MAG: RNA methyltransferase [Ignavibacteriales bacterium]|nr:RNA methyltransferase [Ignavibacteriales bacterium]
MLTKNQIKYYSSLLNKKFRHQEKKFLVEGIKLISEALDSGYSCEIILALKESAAENQNLIKQLNRKKINTEIVKSTDFEKLCDTKNPQGTIGVFHFRQQFSSDFEHEKLIVALENISDPGNVGTIIRNCDWFGVKNILLNLDCAEVYNPKVIRASAGSVFHLNIFEEKDFYNALKEQKKNGFVVLCADLTGENLYDYAFNKKTILVLANEANGPTNNLLEICDSKITIPRIGKAESLNVASASAVILSALSKF